VTKPVRSSAPIHVAVLTATPLPSHGWGRYSRDLIGALTAQGTRITLITTTDAPDDPDLPIESYHRVLPGLNPAGRRLTPRLLAAAPTVRRLSAGCDVLHVIAEPHMLSAMLSPLPKVVTAHGTYLPLTTQRRGVGMLYRMLYRRSRIICVSHYTEKRVQAVLPRANTTVIANGVDAARYQQMPATLPEKHGPTILSVGQAKMRKGFHLLGAAMVDVRKEIPGAKAVIIGDTSADPTFVGSISRRLEALGHADAVQWLGKVPDETLLGWFHTADVFALPALNIGHNFEGFGLVYLEASAAGLPVIGTRECGAEDAIRDGETGLLIPQDNPFALAEALIRLLKDSDLRARMGDAGKRTAAEYTWTRAAEQVRQVYAAAR